MQAAADPAVPESSDNTSSQSDVAVETTTTTSAPSQEEVAINTETNDAASEDISPKVAAPTEVKSTDTKNEPETDALDLLPDIEGLDDDMADLDVGDIDLGDDIDFDDLDDDAELEDLENFLRG